jgi:multicomponent Na+:H+ antiporter subunit B
MKSVILSNAVRIIFPLLLIFSVLLLLRGHDLPGGGFSGGLVAAAAFSLLALADGISKAQNTLRLNTSTLIAIGLMLALISGLIAVFAGAPFMTSYWFEFNFIKPLKIGTPLLFDSGVYLVVLGVILKIVFTLMED